MAAAPFQEQERGHRLRPLIIRRGNRLALAVCLAAAAALSSTASAQPAAERVAILDVDVNHVLTPNFPDSNRYIPGSSRRRQWLQILIEYEAEARRGAWLGQVTFDWTVGIVPGRSKPILMRRSVTYLDVREGRHYAVMYVRPGMIRRYYGENTVDSGDLYVRVLSRVAGGRSGSYHYGRRRRDVPEKWWDGREPAVLVKDSELLTRDETPFGILDYDFFEHLAPSNR